MWGPPEAYLDFLSRNASCAAQRPSLSLANSTSAAWKVRVCGSATGASSARDGEGSGWRVARGGSGSGCCFFYFWEAEVEVEVEGERGRGGGLRFSFLFFSNFSLEAKIESEAHPTSVPVSLSKHTLEAIPAGSGCLILMKEVMKLFGIGRGRERERERERERKKASPVRFPTSFFDSRTSQTVLSRLAFHFRSTPPGSRFVDATKEERKRALMSSMSVDEPSRLAAPRGPRQLLRERRVSMLLRPRDETKVEKKRAKRGRTRESPWIEWAFWSISTFVLVL
jgi:hypothetical protein